MAETLFVYGTLHPDRAPAEIAAVVRGMEPMGAGTIRARLHHFAEYPAIKIDSKNGSRVAGYLFEVASETALKQLDAYEEFYPDEADRSLFQRKPVRVRLADGSRMQAWVYEYNRSLPAVRRGHGRRNRPFAKQRAEAVTSSASLPSAATGGAAATA